MGLTNVGGEGKGRICSITLREFRFIIGSIVWFADLYLQLRYLYLAFGMRMDLQGNDGKILAQSCLYWCYVLTKTKTWRQYHHTFDDIVNYEMSTKKIVIQSTELFMCRSNLMNVGKDIPGQVLGKKNACIVLDCMIWCKNLGVLIHHFHAQLRRPQIAHVMISVPLGCYLLGN